jgi:hypothetical protein
MVNLATNSIIRAINTRISSTSNNTNTSSNISLNNATKAKMNEEAAVDVLLARVLVEVQMQEMIEEATEARGREEVMRWVEVVVVVLAGMMVVRGDGVVCKM